MLLFISRLKETLMDLYEAHLQLTQINKLEKIWFEKFVLLPPFDVLD